MERGKASSGAWKNWVIGVLVVVILVMVFYKPGIRLNPDDYSSRYDSALDLQYSDNTNRFYMIDKKGESIRIQDYPFLRDFNSFLDTGVPIKKIQGSDSGFYVDYADGSRVSITYMPRKDDRGAIITKTGRDRFGGEIIEPAYPENPIWQQIHVYDSALNPLFAYTNDKERTLLVYGENETDRYEIRKTHWEPDSKTRYSHENGWCKDTSVVVNIGDLNYKTYTLREILRGECLVVYANYTRHYKNGCSVFNERNYKTSIAKETKCRISRENIPEYKFITYKIIQPGMYQVLEESEWNALVRKKFSFFSYQEEYTYFSSTLFSEQPFFQVSYPSSSNIIQPFSRHEVPLPFFTS
ncbi:hypothetical protein FJZ22_02720 [Candidatus Pacearchaeota archaeon]|nr:hypothetical protein [Candidatus Pacearchaeota archaeon]